MENGSWLVERSGQERTVLRRYHPDTGPDDLAYEHTVLRHLATAGWVVPHPIGDPLPHRGLWYCLTRYVPGKPVAAESPAQRRRRGRDLARLHLALRGLGERIGQRPGWCPQHTGITVLTSLDWRACVEGLVAVSPRLGAWAQAAAAQTRAALDAIGADQLPDLAVCRPDGGVGRDGEQQPGRGQVGGGIPRGHVTPVEHRREPAIGDHQVPGMKVTVNARVGDVRWRRDGVLVQGHKTNPMSGVRKFAVRPVLLFDSVHR